MGRGIRTAAILITLAAPFIAFWFFFDYAFCADGGDCGPAGTRLWIEMLALVVTVIGVNIVAWRRPSAGPK